ncbi:MAG: thioredoxin [Candidatus Raymondbacteria bacterium RifOxyA12_full_50_37]|uniref:Thioredoxin n=1 Tax=Candidatus Raymondbacteria bacterium RIFOXYD12_FULL_49_13 TaxID=1817890 RepID=A0A1F7FKK8_UNCRA|nr:MAG: thioredoxin [Candidatus Raymondbacteria bacterium RifOxyA12_full_50_37]OGJ94529.1 MAG: thioredoxin [Candidatus Raymondbacteria bacterium RIFOXYA2_FULL_49_16]OGJ98520.1 MAG: thioredoxin [Candidatus Raymondbacteria bacterium RifOxyC12_full_50_8]OGK02853.1 MAG: thioredoxin [Candidatus Raymondbacteria bacterium RifOxyB12_full_50_8]OGK07006.1 MAG: thioredoxin [Candidatus Raymondbacteria bacterium RIFOXYD12_FULL_49_13]OGP45478.1 MAG: thioredoxin [Candidatus Raymondbacteria bacterium RIFOXYB2
MESTKNVLHVTDSNFKAEVIDSDLPVLVDFWAEWCGPCRMLGPTIEKIAEKYQGRVKVVKMNTDEAPQASMAYSIAAIPTVMLFNHGSVVDTLVGVQQPIMYERSLERVV